MAAGTVAVSLHATLQNISQIKNENLDKNNNNNNRVNCEDRNLQQQVMANISVKSVSKNVDNILTVAQQPTSTTNSSHFAGVDGETNAAKNKSSTKKRPRNESASSPELMRCKRRINFTPLGYSIPQAPPTSVARRNERERNRVKLVNMGFATLREHVPNGSKNKKMSKVDTLRSAVEYIRKLQQLLNDEDFDDDDDDEDESSGVGESASGSGLKSDGGFSTGSSDMGSPYRDSVADSPQVFTENLPPVHHVLGHHYHHHSMIPNEHQEHFTKTPNCPPASVSPNNSVSSSPSPSHASDYSSYEPLSPEEEDLLDFTSWFT